MTYLQPVYRPGGANDGGVLQPQGVDPGLHIGSYSGARRIITGSIDLTPVRKVVAGADANRRTITIQNLGANDIYLGGENVSTDNGYKIAANEALTFELAGEIWGVTESTTENLRYMAEVD